MLRERVQGVLSTMLDDERVGLVTIADELAPLSDALDDLLRGGKRMRPAFCYWAWRGSASDAYLDEYDAGVLQAAASLELLQACALIHDDVMDGSDTRRGMPAAHRRFAAHHRDAAWSGSADGFGVGAAILLGDLCLSWADQLLMEAALPVDALARAKPVYDQMRTELMAGQYLDMLEQVRTGSTVQSALRVVRYKSAKYTVERPLHIGAALAGADDHLMAAYSAYGLPLGEAFQLRDDILGVFGDPAVTGKPAGDDLREGKRTVLIALAVERATKTQIELVNAHLGDPALDADGVAALREVIVDTGALDRTELLIDELLTRSLDAIAAAAIRDEARAALVDLAHAATSRVG